MRVVITGGAGNLGSKLSAHLNGLDWVSEVVGIDIKPFEGSGKIRSVVADPSDPRDERWIREAREADGIVHYASANPSPVGSWEESAKSFDMTANLLEYAGGDKPCRFIFASSNHAMGGYKDAVVPNGGIRMGTPQMSGTRFFSEKGYMWGSAYGATKMLGERVGIARAEATRGRITAIGVRIGWNQRGENLATTLSSGGGGGKGDTPEEEAKNLRWFRNMWLSNRDHLQLMEKALTAGAAKWPSPGITVSGMSNNTGMAWALDEAKEWLGYEPVDDVWVDLKKAGMA